MAELTDAVNAFLAQKRIAVVGVSDGKPTPANAIYEKLRTGGYEVFAVNPRLDTYAAQPCYPNVKVVPPPVDGAVLVTRPDVTEQIVRDCVDAGISRVWMHRSFDALGSSVSEEAVSFCREHGISVIPGDVR